MKAKKRDVNRYANQRYDIRKQFVRVLQDPDTLTNAAHAMCLQLLKHGVDLDSSQLRIAANAALGSAIASVTHAKQVRPRVKKCQAKRRRTDYHKTARVRCALPLDHPGYHACRLSDGSHYTWPDRKQASQLILDAIIGGTTNRTMLAKVTDIPERAINSYLNHLKKTGQIHSPKRGEWRITETTCSESE